MNFDLRRTAGRENQVAYLGGGTKHGSQQALGGHHAGVGNTFEGNCDRSIARCSHAGSFLNGVRSRWRRSAAQVKQRFNVPREHSLPKDCKDVHLGNERGAKGRSSGAYFCFITSSPFSTFKSPT